MNNNRFKEHSASFPFFGGGVNRGHLGNDPRDHISHAMTSQGYIHNNLIHRASPWYQTIWNPTSSPYSMYLKKKGFVYPLHKKIGTVYTNVHGKEAQVSPTHRIALVTYTPLKSEKYFQTTEQAMLGLPKTGDWQVLNLISGEILVEPNKVRFMFSK